MPPRLASAEIPGGRGEPFLRTLNRTTLARQRLLERSRMEVVELLEAILGLNAQDAHQPYISLYSRLAGFRKEELEEALRARRAVKATLFRSTLHIVSASDYLRFRPAIQPVLLRALKAFFPREADSLPLKALEEAAEALTREAPRTFPELRKHLKPLVPGVSPQSLSYAARAVLPLVQVPPAGFFGAWGVPAYALAEVWLGKPLGDPLEGQKALARRYLMAYGPATLADLTAFVGMSLREGVTALRSELLEWIGPDGKTYLDLPEAPRVEGEVLAPVRFLPPWDNLLLAYADRSRVLPEAYRSRVILSGGRVQATFLVDGFVAGLWRWQVQHKRARLALLPFAHLSPPAREALEEEGEGLLRFLAEELEPKVLEVVVEE